MSQWQKYILQRQQAFLPLRLRQNKNLKLTSFSSGVIFSSPLRPLFPSPLSLSLFHAFMFSIILTWRGRCQRPRLGHKEEIK